MLRRISLTNFKCFDNLELPLAPLTLLCGLNGMGKSSVLQALLVLRQSFAAGELRHGRLVLGGDLADLGTGQDVLFEDAEGNVVEFGLHHGDISTPCRLSFDYSRDADQLTARPGSFAQELRAWERLPPFHRLLYVGAERIGPRKWHDRSETFARRGELGARGEYALNYLDAHQTVSILTTDPRCGDSSNRKLPQVVDHWLQDVSPGAHLQIEAIPDADALIGGFSFDRPGDVATRRYRATNVGFGLSYILPVLTALLAPSGTLCLIENPEAHLHPRGQTRLAELSVRASLAGVQVIAETHSDHFMDGVRIAVRDGLIQPEGTAFHYFERDGAKTVVTSPQVNADGRLDSWPTGFFDQHEENLAKLIAPRF